MKLISIELNGIKTNETTLSATRQKAYQFKIKKNGYEWKSNISLDP